jgi:hypothetical protein
MTQVFVYGPLGLSFEQALVYEPVLGEIPPIISSPERENISPGWKYGSLLLDGSEGKKPRSWKCWRSCQRGGS